VLDVNDAGTDKTPRRAAERMSIFGRDEIRGHGFGDVIGREELLFGERTERIVQLASDRNIDMIVMGQKHTSEIRARIAAHLPGGVAYNVIAKAQCAVWTVPDSAHGVGEMQPSETDKLGPRLFGSRPPDKRLSRTEASKETGEHSPPRKGNQSEHYWLIATPLNDSTPVGFEVAASDRSP
jgi:hypothetical protein